MSALILFPKTRNLATELNLKRFAQDLAAIGPHHPSRPPLSRLLARMSLLDPRVEFVQADAMALPDADQTFDVAAAVQCAQQPRQKREAAVVEVRTERMDDWVDVTGHLH